MASMTTRAAVLHKPGNDWEITELDLDEPKDYEVLIRYKAAGLCHSDEHIREEGGSHIRLPLVGGHEGAGVVEAVGAGVTRVRPVITSSPPTSRPVGGAGTARPVTRTCATAACTRASAASRTRPSASIGVARTSADSARSARSPTTRSCRSTRA